MTDNPYTQIKIKGKSSRSEVEAGLIEAKRVLNYIEIDLQYTDGVLMFIAPYHLEGALGLIIHIEKEILNRLEQ